MSQQELHYYYSPSIKGFYCKEAQEKDMKKDCVAITLDVYNEFFDKTTTGWDATFDVETATFSYSPHVPPNLTTERAAELAKQNLIDTDYLIVRDTFEEIEPDKQAQLLSYRKYLRQVMKGTIDLTGMTELKKLEDF